MKHGFSMFLYGVALTGLLVLAGVVVANLPKTTEKLEVSLNESKSDAILASANIGDDATVRVPLLYYVQTADACADLYAADAGNLVALKARQFEWASCGYYNSEIETGLVEGTLNEKYLPVATGAGVLTSNRGVTAENFSRWFAAAEGKSEAYPGNITLTYDAEQSAFIYESEDFYPATNVAANSASSVDLASSKLFTLSLGVPFRTLNTGLEEFTIAADDDTWVFIGDKLVLDMGGVHDATTAHFVVYEDGEVYAEVADGGLAYAGVKLTENDGAIVRIFHANRDSFNSVFKLKFKNMVLNVTTPTLASQTEDGIVLAYDPANPSYVPPLGESLTVAPNYTRVLVTALIVQLLALAVTLTVITFLVVRYWRRGRNPAK